MDLLLKSVFLSLVILLSSAILGNDFPDVVIIANGLDAESVALAEYYASIRSIPLSNVVRLNLPDAESISWTQFENNIYEPLLIELNMRGLLDNFDEKMLFDRRAKDKPSFITHSIDYMVIMKGTPLKIKQSEAALHNSIQPLWMKQSGLKMDYASVDSEISLLLLGGNRKAGWLNNPYFNHKEVPSVYDRTYLKVSRIDGPTFDDCRRIIKNTIIAENKGLIGRAYIDRGEDTKLGEDWLKRSARIIRETGLDLTEDISPGLLDYYSRFDMPALYMGWYAYNAQGPWQKESVSFPPGAIFLHIHSFSGTTVRSVHKNWVGPMVSAGVTATVGNVNEPYLEMTHHPHLLLEALIDGMNWADAVYYSLPVLSWQSFAIGDPLYRPFKVTLEQQMEGDWMKWCEGQYIAIRYINTLIAAGYIHQALEWGMTHLQRYPGRVLALKVASVAENIRDFKTMASAIRTFLDTKTNGKIQDKLLIRDAIKLLELYRGNEALEKLKVELIDELEKN